MKNERNIKGLTLVELIVAMIVTSIVLTAVVTLAYALGTVNDVTDETSKKQAQIRFAALRVSELIRHCKLVCYASTDEIVLWRADDKYIDGKINIGELVYIEAGAAQDHLRLCEFDPSNSTAINPDSIGSLATNWWLAYSGSVNYTTLIRECSNVQFGFDVFPVLPALASRLVSISYDVVENGITRQCQINATLRGWAGNLLDSSGNIVSDDD